LPQGREEGVVTSHDLGEMKMEKTLMEIAENIIYWWSYFSDGSAKAEDRNGGVLITLYDSEGEEHYVGSFADPGIMLKNVGAAVVSSSGTTRQLVEVNGVIMSALGREIAGWAYGSP